MQRALNIVVGFSAHSLLWLVIGYQETMKAVWFCLGRVAGVHYPFIIRESGTVVKERKAWYWPLVSV